MTFPSQITESMILRDCLNYLQLKRIPHWRISVQGIPLHGKNEGKFRPASNKGMSDIIALNKGIAIAIECKRPRINSKQSSAQIMFQNEWRRGGGEYWLVRSVKDLIAKIV